MVESNVRYQASVSHHPNRNWKHKEVMRYIMIREKTRQVVVYAIFCEFF